MTVTREFARCIVRIDAPSLPAEVVSVAKQVVLDGIAVMVAGCHEESPDIVARHIQEMGGRELCTVVGHGFRTSPTQAAYVNGVSCHVLDFEPMWQPPTHPTSATLPVALALAQWLGLTGSAVIAGLVAGFESQGRIRVATAHLNPGDLTSHPPGTVGVMGAAATGARMLELDEDQTCAALGIAGSRAAALMANVGFMTKSNHCGNAARLGLEAALLARDGYSANPDIFAAPRGYAEGVFAGRFDLDALTQGFGQSFRMVDPGLIFKRFPCQIATHFAIEAALTLRTEHHLSPESITSVTLETPVMEYVDRPFPASGLEGKSSFQYVVASALLDGDVTIDTFSDTRLQMPDMQSMLRRVDLQLNPDIPGSLDRMWVTLRLTLRDGRQVTATCRRPPGYWDGTSSFDIRRTKVRNCLDRRLSASDINQVIDVVAGLDRLGAGEVRDLVEKLQ